MKVSSDVAPAAIGAPDARASENVEAGEFAALLAGLAGLQNMLSPIDLGAVADTGSPEGGAPAPAMQMPMTAVALATMTTTIDLTTAAAPTSPEAVAPASAPADAITFEVLSASIGEVSVITTAPKGAAVAPTGPAIADEPAAAAPVAGPTVATAPVTPAGTTGADAGMAGEGHGSSAEDTGPARIAPATTHKAAVTEADGAFTAPTAPVANVAPTTTPELRANETKMVVAPSRIDTVAVAAARASAEADRPIRLSVRLDPPNLGELRVELTARGGQVTIRLEPTNANVAPTLSQQRAAVADALERTGFQLSGFDIANPEQQQQQQGFAQKRNNARATAAIEEIDAEDIPATDGLRL